MSVKGQFVTRSGQVGLGVVASGIGTFLMLGAIARLTSPTDFAVFATWWFFATLVVYPLGVLETLLARLVVARISVGADPRASVAAVLSRGGPLVAGGVLLLLVLDPFLADRVLRGNAGLSMLAAAFLTIGFAQTMQRGLASGRGSFSVIALQLSSDGLLRALLGGLAAWQQPGRPVVVCASVCAASACSVAICHTRSQGWLTVPGHVGRLQTRLVLLLMAGALGPILINNAAIPWLSASGASALTVGAFSGALTLSRIPIQLSSAVFGPLLNRLAHAKDSGDTATFAKLNRDAVVMVSAFAATFAVVFIAVGGVALELFLGQGYDLPLWTWAGLGGSSAVMLISVVVQARAAAHQHWSDIARSWMLGAAVFIVCLLMPLSTLGQATLAPVAAGITALAALTVAARRRGAGTTEPDNVTDS